VQLRQLGGTGLEISVVGYGAWQAGGSSWGERRPDAQVVDAMRAAIDSGQTWIDTAEVYGDGVSERLVGKAVAGRRDDVLLFTKVAPSEEGSGLRPEQIRSAIQGSLERLGVDHVDLYQVHWPEPQVPLEETWGAMAELVREGLVRHIGVSNFDRPLIERCLAIHPVASVQNEFSLLHPGDGETLLPWLREQGIGYLCYSPLASGLLTGAYGRDTTFGPDDWRSRELSASLIAAGADMVQRMRPIAERLGVTVPVLALSWALHQPGVTAVIAGSLKAANVRANAAAGDLRLDAATLRELAVDDVPAA
jgi:aryl-alcohol dehydrogenase-like predicted oxidoreductase